MKLTILVTGATGFVGRVVVEKLQEKNTTVKAVVRNQHANFTQSKTVTPIIVSAIDGKTDFSGALATCATVIHCAARVHVMNNEVANPLEAFRETNTFGTLNLAQQAADAGVKRFIFISSIKVNGESTELGKPFKPDDDFIPTDPYGLSKYEAEVGLRKIAIETGMEVVIIRPPLVYGAGVKANFAAMMKWVNKGLPLPLGAIKQNKRSLVAVENLVDLIITCIDHPKAANETFLVSDDNDVSTTGLLQNMALALNVSRRLIPVPASWFELAVKLIGKPGISQRLCGSLQVDISKTKILLGWKPPYSVAESMKKTAEGFLKNSNE